MGQVKNYVLAEDDSTVEVQLYIQPEYAHGAQAHRFWNASGVTVDAGLTGVKFRTESRPVSSPGASPSPRPRTARTARPPTRTSRSVSTRISTQPGGDQGRGRAAGFRWAAGRTHAGDVQRHAGWSAEKAGYRLGPQGCARELSVDPLFEDHGRGHRFLVKPSISLGGITGLEALVKGNFIAVRPGEKGGSPKREFVARKAPPLDIRAPGLHLVLTTDSLGSLDVGSPVLYRQVRVGYRATSSLATSRR